MTSITQWSRAEQRLEQERIALAELIAEAWNAAGINYAVLHGLEAYPSGPLGRDLDILVEASQRWQALQLAVSTWRGKGWSVCRHRKPWGWWVFAFRRHSAGISALEIDLTTHFRWGPGFLVRVPQPAQWRGPFAVDPWASVVKQIILPVLSNRMERLQEQPSKLSRDPGEQAALHARLPRFVGKSLSEELVAVLEKTDIEQLRRLAPSLRRAFLRRSLLGRPLECVRASLAWVRDEGAERMSLRCAPTLSVEGPDGVGKSTALEQVGHQVPRFFTQIVIKHWRPGLLPRLGHLLGRSADSAGVPMPPRRTAGKFGALRLAYYGVDFILGSYLLDGRDSSLIRLVLYDRWALDMMVDPYRYGLRASRGTRLFWKLVPKPDRAILLFDSPDRIVARKAELEKDEIERQLREWLRLARRGHVDAVIRVDAPPEELARRITDLVITSFIEKNGGDLTARIRAEERLREMVAALGGGGGVELRVDGGKDRLLPSGRNGYSTPLFAVLPSATKPRLLIPLHNRKAAAAALRVYNPQKRLARLAKRLLAATLRLGLAQPLLRPRASLLVSNGDSAVTPPDFALQEHLREVFGVKQLITSISLGTPGVHQKPLIQAMTPDGRVLGYVKVGWNERTIPLVQREEVVLRRLEAVRFSTALVPGVLHAGWWNGCYLLVQQPPPEKWKSAPQHPGEEHLAFLRELQQFGARPQVVPLEQWIGRIRERLAVLKNQGMFYRAHLIEWTLETCLRRAAGCEVSVGLRHGDFTPWNMVRTGGKIFVFDWEYSEDAGLPAWDLFHFLVQPALLVRNQPGHQVYENVVGGQARACVERHLRAIGVPLELYEVLFALYVAEVASWYFCRDGCELTGKAAALGKAWEKILFLFSASEMEKTWVNA